VQDAEDGEAVLLIEVVQDVVLVDREVVAAPMPFSRLEPGGWGSSASAMMASPMSRSGLCGIVSSSRYAL
jgi:hypothetical protein